VRRRKAPSTGLPVRVLDQRDRVRDALGAKWPWAIVAVVAKWAFDYFALVAAVAATGVRVDSLSLFLAYVTASVLSMIPITPGGLGFVEAGLAATLVWAGLPSGNATLATLAYRLVSYWLPLVVGTPVALFMRGKDAGGGTSPTESSVRDLGPDRNDPIRP